MTDESLLAKLAEEFTAEMRAGKPADIEAYACKYPKLAERIRELFPTLMMLEGMAGADDPASAKPPDQPELSPDTMFGQYRIKREIGSMVLSVGDNGKAKIWKSKRRNE